MGLFKRRRTRTPPRPRRMYTHDTYKAMTNGYAVIDSHRAIKVIIADYAMREQVQREETLGYRAAASRKATAIEDDQSQSKEEDKMFEQARKQYSEKERNLFRALSLLDQNTKDNYDTSRRDPAWYMSEGLIQDCSDQGGCCSRQCGCCKKRHLTGLTKGIGHCTSECWCCMSFRGFDLSDDQKKEIRENLELRLGERDKTDLTLSPYLLRIAPWFFSPPCIL